MTDSCFLLVLFDRLCFLMIPAIIIIFILIFSKIHDACFNFVVHFSLSLRTLLTIGFNPFAPGDFADKRVLRLVEWFSGHCRAIRS